MRNFYSTTKYFLLLNLPEELQDMFLQINYLKNIGRHEIQEIALSKETNLQ